MYAIRDTGYGIRDTVRKGRNQAFTLVEVIFVIAIVGVLASILLPGFQKIRKEAQKIEDVSHLKKIAEAYKIYIERFGRMITFNGIRMAESFAWGPVYGNDKGENLISSAGSKENCVLNDASVYISSGDKYASKAVRTSVGSLNSSGTYDYGRWNEWQNPWKNNKCVLGYGNDQPLFSYVLIGGLSEECSPETTPVAFTRGLTDKGTWDKDYGLYGESGGYVAYLDGHVRWFDGKRPARFLKPDKSGYSSNIADAVPDGATFSCGHHGAEDGLGLQRYTNSKGETMIYDGYATEHR